MVRMEQTMKTEKGKDAFVDNEGFVYLFNKDGAGGKRIMISEENRRASNCPARVHVRDGDVVKVVNQHTHLPDSRRVEARCIRNVLQAEAGAVDAPGQLLGHDSFASASNETLATLPSKDNIKRSASSRSSSTPSGTCTKQPSPTFPGRRTTPKAGIEDS